MSTIRDALVREIFETVRDITWTEQVAEKHLDEDVEKLRGAFNRHMEADNFAWWNERAKRYSRAELEDMLADYVDRADAVGIERQCHSRKL